MNDSIYIDSVFLNFNTVKVLRGINLVFKANKVTGLLGRNGCGKSCLLKIITGHLKPQSKYLKYQDKVLTDLYKIQGLINYAPQHEFHPKSIQLKTLLKLYGIKAAHFFNQYPFLEALYTEKMGHLSGGERRLIEVCLVLESDSKFTILDEPFMHIMPKYIDLVKERIVANSSRKGILVTDHLYENVLDISGSLYLMKGGILQVINNKVDLQQYGYIY